MTSADDDVASQMPWRALGSTGLEVSALGLGLVKLGRTGGLKHPLPFELPSDREARALLDAARELGINLLDTAPAYGTSESRLGALLRPGERDRWIISTKAGEERAAGESRYAYDPQTLRHSVERSLERLGADYVDITLVHSSGADTEILERDDPIAALADCRARGLTRAVGFSGKTVTGALLALRQGADVLMLSLNDDEPNEADVLRAAAAAGAGVLIKKPLASGYAEPARLTDLAAREGVSSVVVGTLSRAHLRANARLVAAL
ncbi:MAG: aldo/keto reductase [Pseudomonadota bacterium]